MNLTEFSDYRTAFFQLIQSRKSSVGSRFTASNLAKHCGMQKTNLSAVLNLKAHFNDDQLFLATEFFSLSELESEYLSVLRSFQRAYAKSRLAFLKKRLERVKKDLNATAQYLDVTESSLTESQVLEYFLDPMAILVHVLLTIKKFAVDVKKISTVLAISDERLTKIINTLFQLKIIEVQKGVVVVVKDKLHLDRDSPAFLAHHSLVRSLATDKMLRSPNSKKMGFTACFTANEEFLESMRRDMLALLQRYQKLADGGDSCDRLCQINIDLMDWCVT